MSFKGDTVKSLGRMEFGKNGMSVWYTLSKEMTKKINTTHRIAEFFSIIVEIKQCRNIRLENV